MKCIVLTRPRNQAEKFARMLCSQVRAVGVADILIEPLLEVRKYKDVSVQNPQKYSCYIVTGIHAVDYMPKDIDDNVRVLCVGQSVAERLADLGWKAELVAPAVRSLLHSLSVVDDYKSERMLYLCGRDVQVDLQAELKEKGYNIDTLEVYCADGVSGLSADFLNALENGEIGLMTFFSSRTAEQFVKLADKAGVSDLFSDIKVLCISDAVLGCVHSVCFEEMLVAETPDARGMIDAIGAYV